MGVAQCAGGETAEDWFSQSRQVPSTLLYKADVAQSAAGLKPLTQKKVQLKWSKDPLQKACIALGLFKFAGACHFRGNTTKAVEYWERAGDFGCSDGLVNCVMAFRKGYRGILPASKAKIDEQQCAKLLRKAFDLDNPEAGVILSEFLITRIESFPDGHTDARRILKKAAKRGSVRAQEALGVMYFNGAGVPQSDTMAAECYRKGSEQGHAMCMFNLGRMLLSGAAGVAKDENEGRRWLQLSASKGRKKAEQRLNVMNMVNVIPIVSTPQRPDVSQGDGSCQKCGAEPEANRKKFSKCSRCREVVYCSKECQKLDWKQHKGVCGLGRKEYAKRSNT